MAPTPLYLDIGYADIRVNFFDHDCVNLAMKHLCLQEQTSGRTIGTINYILNNRISGLVRVSYPPNAVYIGREDLPDGGNRTLLKMYDRYTIALDSYGPQVFVRYPSNVPNSILVDDVFQAALSPLLLKAGGFILHGSCAVLDNTAIAIMGLSGSGKSTTAFALTRFGFQCYSDDAVIAVPNGNQIHVYPLDREISIRPLSFRLYEEQNFVLDDYRQEGEKYYFKLNHRKPFGAVLKFICFAEVSGEIETRIEFLNPDRMVDVLLSEEKHFTFINRENAPNFSYILCKAVPNSFRAFIGSDIEHQGKIFTSIVKDTLSPSGRKIAYNQQNGRAKKKALIRSAWAAPESAPLKSIISLLGDYDMKILKLTHGFFQTFTQAKIEPVLPVGPLEKTPGHFEAAWFRATEWLDGCNSLVSGYRAEVFEKFSISWIISAPLLFPFLYAAAIHQPDKAKIICSAWKNFKGRYPVVQKNEYRIVSASFSNNNNQWILLDSFGNKAYSNLLKSTRVYCLFDETESAYPTTMTGILKELEAADSIIAVPICGSDKNLINISPEFVRQAVGYGLNTKLSRHTPFCLISEADANFLLNTNTFQLSEDSPDISAQRPENSDESLNSPDFIDKYVKKNYPSCSLCGFYPLGLCRGGYVKKDKL